MDIEPKKRSIGVSLFGWAYIVGAIGALISMFFLKSRLSEYAAKHFDLPESYYYVVQTHYAIEFLFCLIIGVGLLKLIPRALFLVVIQSLFYFMYSAIFFIVYTYNYTIPYFLKTGRPTFILYVWIPISIIWIVFVVYFFNRASVKIQFNRLT